MKHLTVCAVALLTPLSMQAGAPQKGAPASPALPPFEALGKRLLDEADQDLKDRARNAARQRGDEAFVSRLEVLHERFDLGALELWCPRVVANERLQMENASRPREWRDIAERLLTLQRRWSDALGAHESTAHAELPKTFERLSAVLKRAPGRGPLARPEQLEPLAAQVRQAMLGSEWRRHGLLLLAAPTRAHYQALLGAAGVQWPALQPALWQVAARRAANQRISSSCLAFALAWGPLTNPEPWHTSYPMEAGEARQQALHAASHLLSSTLVPNAPLWFNEGLAILDTVAIEHADETLCAGYKGRGTTPFDGLMNLPQAWLIHARLERSPFRHTDSSDGFLDKLREALSPEGFAILDLDRGALSFHAPGPFLGDSSRAPAELDHAPPGVQEGFAEFFRAYCAGFVKFLEQEELDGKPPLLPLLRRLRELQSAHPFDDLDRPELEQATRDLTGLALGGSLDAEHDLEGRFVAWLRQRVR